MPFCPNCSTSIKADAKFCHKCGFKIKSTLASSPRLTSSNPLDHDIVVSASEIQQIASKYQGTQVGEFVSDQIKSFLPPLKSNKMEKVIRRLGKDSWFYSSAVGSVLGYTTN